MCVQNLCTNWRVLDGRLVRRSFVVTEDEEVSMALPCVFEPLKTYTHYKNGGPGGGRNSFAGYSYTIRCTECKHVFRNVNKRGGDSEFLKAGEGFVKKKEYETSCPKLAR